jgi:hypothetical protein
MQNLQKYVFQSLFTHFTAGETIKSLQSKINQLEKKNLYPIVDYIKESSDNNHKVNNAILQYIKLSDIPKIDYIALKLSSFGFHEQKIDYVVENLIHKDKKVMIDAEQVDKQDKIDDITNNLIYKYNKKEINVYKTYQMYRKDGLSKLNYDINHINHLGIKLVRGAYYNQDYNTNKLYSTMYETNMAFDDAMNIIFKSNNTHSFICTHNYVNINQMIDYVKNNNSNKIAHASLYGFINNDIERIIKAGITTYKYLPYGNFDDAIPYLTRRIYENPQILLYLLK